ncbi:MAG: alpha/beta hydrolase, partial [Thermomicrobiales bacterium]|nr:alpha/beta hydrolase [Thermomicrobiales bacterium]
PMKRLASEPTYTATLCPDPNVAELGPVVNLPAGFTCGYLTVPENRANPNGRTIRVAVARVPAVSATPRPDPIVYLTGGPGGIAFLDAVGLVAAGINADRDVIFVEQRGTYHSEPFLACRENDEFLTQALSLPYAAPATGERDVASVRACRDHWAAAGVDLAAFNSAENAADIADLRVALGIDQWNVFGVSYGTDLAQWLLRDHPDGIRSVVLDSVVPINQSVVAEWWPAAAMGYRAIFDACSAQPACAAAYPGLEATFTATVNRLHTEPLVVETANASGVPITVTIDGYTFANLIVQQSYSGEPGFRTVPAMIDDVAQGNGQMAAAALLARESPPGLVGYGLGTGAYCREMAAQTTPQEVARLAEQALPAFHADLFEFVPVAGRIFAECAVWDVGAAAAADLRPVASDVPVLLLGGTWDMVTPYAWAEIVAAGLPNAQVVAIPGGGHGLVQKFPCARAMLMAFLDDPGAEVDTSCASDIPAPVFTAP